MEKTIRPNGRKSNTFNINIIINKKLKLIIIIIIKVFEHLSSAINNSGKITRREYKLV